MKTRQCPRCDAPLVEIAILIDGDEVKMRSCTVCDSRSWHRFDRPTDLGEVLDGLTDETERRKNAAARR
ncbi:MAG: hypothetical protein JJLCMIEE_03429 [Acidimicrobiales bacterium]|nr:MAG: hypothetical protein EDR02_15455 [Actinomycetota bacterium]MBV6510290.1 hypothetical protein [Acidimicrobiales bacterium]RIK03374.1 MAG: hypothetical protein DCC48_16625 [Acidobacteriota bacterium]